MITAQEARDFDYYKFVHLLDHGTMCTPLEENSSIATVYCNLFMARK